MDRVDFYEIARIGATRLSGFGKFLFVVLDKTEKTLSGIYDSTFNIEAKFVVGRFFTLKYHIKAP